MFKNAEVQDIYGEIMTGPMFKPQEDKKEEQKPAFKFVTYSVVQTFMGGHTQVYAIRIYSNEPLVGKDDVMVGSKLKRGNTPTESLRLDISWDKAQNLSVSALKNLYVKSKPDNRNYYSEAFASVKASVERIRRYGSGVEIHPPDYIAIGNSIPLATPKKRRKI